MDDFLDRSDELHVEILELLDGLPAYPGVRHEVALVAFGMALEHALSLIESPLVSYTYSNGSLWPKGAGSEGLLPAKSSPSWKAVSNSRQL
ncbi:hypothetical protein RGV33_10615 [Pseudomonas sp. Bout1]|uniref:hypothetical protein n=1 Tax=Pseudomonas sp. Bout1 TaxID=3048600 RepID=UPI002AB41F63|nr:hypothetical protein [Pseudomonas sp. Bout1]MDY7532134.1 hypothetical protein [Pseudomonas sp. Bout1]MEB0189109.1 hypothetical protein [Pseudomonas sp. Bout1]